MKLWNHDMQVFFVFSFEMSSSMTKQKSLLLQIYLMDVFLGGQFTTYGTDVLAISEQPMENRIDPMAKVFPKVTRLGANS